MPRYRIIIEYDGSNYCGWQKQKDLSSVTSEIETAITKFSGESVDVFGAGRTDAGVHAKGQVAHFDLESTKHSPFRIREALNYHLRKRSICIILCEEVTSDFDARFSAIKRHYEYIILNRNARPALEKNRVWHIKNNLDLNLMQQAANLLIGKHDFSSFRSSECQASSPIKTIDYITIKMIGDHIFFNIGARSFLHNMVRNIVGSLKYVGQGKMTLAQFEQGFVSKDRCQMGPTAPAAGLYFMKVEYPS